MFRKRMAGCLENMFYRNKVTKLNALGESKHSLGDDLLGLESRKHRCEKTSNSKLLKPINLLILIQTMVVSLTSRKSWYYVSQIKLVVEAFCAVVYPQIISVSDCSDLHLSDKIFRNSPNSDSNKIQAWICGQIINSWN